MTKVRWLYVRWCQAKNKQRLFKIILMESVTSEAFGLDEWRYTFKDNSKLVYRKLTKEFVL